MALRRALRLVDAVSQAPPFTTQPTGRPMASPWSAGQLSSIVWADVLGADLLPPSREEALSVPAVMRARNLLAGTVASLPLRALRADQLVAPQPSWLYRTDGQVPYLRMAWTVDDLLFAGLSVWAVERDAAGFVLAAARVRPDLYEWDSATGALTVHGEPVDAASVVIIEGAHGGILATEGRALREAAWLERSAMGAARNPVPAVELHQLTDDQPADGEAAGLIRDWAAAMAGGGIAYTSSALEVRTHGTQPEQLLISGRNAAAVNVARMTNVPAALLDATSAGASLTYETVAGRNAEFLDYGVRLFTDPIAARLSMDDVVPRGQRVAFDVSEFTAPGPTPTGPVTED